MTLLKLGNQPQVKARLRGEYSQPAERARTPPTSGNHAVIQVASMEPGRPAAARAPRQVFPRVLPSDQAKTINFPRLHQDQHHGNYARASFQAALAVRFETTFADFVADLAATSAAWSRIV
jgi:hypothetical protein